MENAEHVSTYPSSAPALASISGDSLVQCSRWFPTCLTIPGKYKKMGFALTMATAYLDPRAQNMLRLCLTDCRLLNWGCRYDKTKAGKPTVEELWQQHCFDSWAGPLHVCTYLLKNNEVGYEGKHMLRKTGKSKADQRGIHIDCCPYCISQNVPRSGLRLSPVISYKSSQEDCTRLHQADAFMLLIVNCPFLHDGASSVFHSFDADVRTIERPQLQSFRTYGYHSKPGQPMVMEIAQASTILYELLHQVNSLV